MFKPWVYYATVAATAALLSFAYWLGHSNGKTEVMLKWDRDRLAQAQAAAARERAHRATEREWAESMKLALEWEASAQEKLRNDYENAIADIESNTNRLRSDLRGCRADRVPGDTASPGAPDDASKRGLSAARQRVALRIGSDCDAVAVRLNALQLWVDGILLKQH